MKVYVYNCPNTYNYGSMMMGENFISYFDEVTGQKNTYYIETIDTSNIARLKKAAFTEEIYPVTMDALFLNGTGKYDYLFSYAGLKQVISKLAEEIDLVVVLGGDDFTEDYGWKGPILNAVKFNLLVRKGLKVVMLGQTMGPFHSFRQPVMKKLLGKINRIYPRDSITQNYLAQLGLKNITITDDLALLPLKGQEEKVQTGEYITYCPSELIFRYAREGKREDWVRYNLFMIRQVMQRYPEKKLVLIAHVLSPEDADDRKMVNELYELTKDVYPGRISMENEAMLPSEVRNYIQQSYFTLSSRMHPIVSSIQCEIPAIALSYSSKFWGIIGERYQLGDYIIDVRQLTYKEMENRFVQMLDQIETENTLIREKMKNNNKLAKENILKTLTEIKGLV